MDLDLGSSWKYFTISQKYSWKNLFAYRAVAIFWILDSITSILSSLVPIVAIYSVSAGILGWSFYQILLLSGSASLVVGVIYYMITGWSIVNMMQEGQVDVYLLRPYGKFTIFMSSFTDVSSVAQMVGSMVIIGIAAVALGLSAYSMLIFGVLFLFGMIALTCFLMMLTILSYHLFKSAMFYYRIVSAISAIGNYPLVVFGTIGRILFTVFFPIALAYYYPAATIIGTTINLTFVGEFILGCIVMSFVCYRLFYYLITKYTSGGG